MKDNVIILGAGASKQAGIPLLADFVEQMVDIHQRQKCRSGSISGEDKGVFHNAINVIRELNGYHGRSAFDDRNIEDILSILSFNVMGGDDAERLKWDAIIKAIARTIELTCTVEYDHGTLDQLLYKFSNRNYYVEFWAGLFNVFKSSRQFPTIISFNYDLVLERALFQLINGGQYGTNANFNQRGPFPYKALSLHYHDEHGGRYDYKVSNHGYRYTEDGRQPYLVDGDVLEPGSIDGLDNTVEIELLKLHGSLNFPTEVISIDRLQPPTSPASNPYLLPPIFNKLSKDGETEMWKVALSRLRTAKRIFIIGYSLPRTDIYMQYFLKTALGPNLDLRSVVVFNPVLFRNGGDADDMRKRYGECFAPQFQKHIQFQPRWHWIERGDDPKLGTFEHFCEAIQRDSELFFLS